MSYHLRIQRTIECIESSLMGPLSLSELAGVAGFSDYHFHRVFQIMVGDSVMEYVRKRKLAVASVDISRSQKKIVDIALDYGFHSHETFTRAFKRMFGMTPNEYRKRGIHTALYPKVSLMMNKYNPYLGGIRMEYRMMTIPAFKLIGYDLQTSTEQGKSFHDIPDFWSSYFEMNGRAHIPNALYKEFPVELGVCTDFDLESGSFTYLIGMEAEHFDNVPPDLKCREILEATYAVFTTPKVPRESFTSSIQATWKAIFEEWFPHSGYEYADSGTEFEWYDDRSNMDKHELLQIDIYIPVKERRE